MFDTSIFELIGRLIVYLLITQLSVKLLKLLFVCFQTNDHIWKPSTTSWAVITGASDGIGLEYAKQLAEKGYSLLIISRSDDKLSKTREEILSLYPKCSAVETLAVDFSKADIYKEIESVLNKLEVIDVLVNNVGMTFEVGEYLTRIVNIQQFITSIINVNVKAMTLMIENILPKMVDRKRGIIINISSMSASYPTPLLSIYSASKAYCDYLSRGLHYEYKDKGIIIQSVLPAFVSTKMTRIKPSFLVPTAHRYVEQSLKTVGFEERTYGFWTHKLIGFYQDVIISYTFGPNRNSINVKNKLEFYRKKFYKKNNLIDNF